MPLGIMLVAGEASGDTLGAALMRAIRIRSETNIDFFGVGGELMEKEGLTSLFPMSDLSIMGFTEVLPRIPRLLSRIRQTTKLALTKRPDVLITIDAPSFTLRVARSIRGKGIPRVHYVAPQLWAWRPERAHDLYRSVDRLLALFPFEKEFFAKYGVDCSFVGHPVIESRKKTLDDGLRFRKRFDIAKKAKLVVVLPGSRRNEIKRHLPIFCRVLANLSSRVLNVHPVLVAVPDTVAEVKKQLLKWELPVTLVETRENRFDVFAAANAALAVSGTISLELAIAEVPSIIAYRTGILTAAIARRMISVNHIAMPNLIVGERVVPEFVQERCNAVELTTALENLLEAEDLRAKQIKGLSLVANSLGAGCLSPSFRAADEILNIIESGQRSDVFVMS